MLLIVILCWYGVGVVLAATTVRGPETTLQEVFHDDFVGIKLNTSRWNAADTKSYVNEELEYYRPDNVRVSNGSLRLVSRREEFGGCRYTSGRVDTAGKFSFLRGEVEWRARIPAGRGVWSVLWLEHPLCAPAVQCHDHWPPAITVMDVRGDEPNIVATTVFYWNGTQVLWPGKPTDMKQNLSKDFHLYKLIWTEEALLWFVDGVLVFTVVGAEKVPTEALQVVMNVAIGGTFPGSPDNNTPFPTEFLIDYVVVRQGHIDVSRWVNVSSGNREPASGAPVLAIVLGSLAGVLGISIVGILFGFLYRKYRLRIGDMRKGSATNTDSTLLTTRSPYLTYLIDSGQDRVDSAIQHYVDLLEIPLANIEMGAVLGMGEYGIVRKGVATGLRGQPMPTAVAVKMVRDRTDVEQNRQIIQEMKIMTRAGRHLNIINLLGAVFKGEAYLLLEYSRHGSLLTYLRCHHGAYFYNQTDTDGQMQVYSAAEVSRLQQAANQTPPTAAQNEEFDRKVMSTRDLISFAFQVSRGMTYLNSRSIIHRDLAARNVLVCHNDVVKIADFGMARQLSEYVLLNEQVALPVRWMAPESIRQRTFSQKSDVWSFGVLMWELFSLGETPYGSSALGIGYVTEFLARLLQGVHMERSPACPSVIYDIMVQCWRPQPDDRPVFSHLEQQLTGVAGRDYVLNYLALDEPYQQFNVAHQDLLDEIVDESRYENTETELPTWAAVPPSPAGHQPD
ncbi:vascular endothelial growth factor receptor 3-like [Paramacrobiotus metropolitanus]|uniref:vascular endothelial growth factor receptor 3-like n=1 Tax=Paramacrobiotus metropolitanus TaxID=2943436 RepID=UPI002445C5B2|nr:vascular endothelial growth factor receptor 3-like [Paramacrobiotus metropolitanus]